LFELERVHGTNVVILRWALDFDGAELRFRVLSVIARN